MTPFETASLWAAYGHVVATVVIGLGQIAIVWYGIRAMQAMGNQRAHEQDGRHEETMQALADAARASERRHEERERESGKRERENERRHEEAMQALEALIERTGGRRRDSAPPLPATGVASARRWTREPRRGISLRSDNPFLGNLTPWRIFPLWRRTPFRRFPRSRESGWPPARAANAMPGGTISFWSTSPEARPRRA